MDEYTRLADGLASLLGRVLSGLIEIDPVESRLARETESIGQREILAIELSRNHPELA